MIKELEVWLVSWRGIKKENKMLSVIDIINLDNDYALSEEEAMKKYIKQAEKYISTKEEFVRRINSNILNLENKLIEYRKEIERAKSRINTANKMLKDRFV